jgi:hypothetical protein
MSDKTKEIVDANVYAYLDGRTTLAELRDIINGMSETQANSAFMAFVGDGRLCLSGSDIQLELDDEVDVVEEIAGDFDRLCDATRLCFINMKRYDEIAALLSEIIEATLNDKCELIWPKSKETLRHVALSTLIRNLEKLKEEW